MLVCGLGRGLPLGPCLSEVAILCEIPNRENNGDQQDVQNRRHPARCPRTPPTLTGSRQRRVYRNEFHRFAPHRTWRQGELHWIDGHRVKRWMAFGPGWLPAYFSPTHKNGSQSGGTCEPSAVLGVNTAYERIQWGAELIEPLPKHLQPGISATRSNSITLRAWR